MKAERIEPGPEQESVWDYPRPPRLEESARQIQVVVADVVIAQSRRTLRVLETSQPPAFYIPPDDVQMELLRPSPTRTECEWKGTAHYFDLLVAGRETRDAAWCYPSPTPPFAALAGYLAFYPQRVDACFVDGERVQLQEGSFYGGWITNEIVGPFKGGPGTMGW